MLMKRLGIGALMPALLLSVTACGTQPSAQSNQQTSTQNTTSNASQGSGTLIKFVPTASKGQKVQSFQFTDQDGKPFGSADLKGKVWIANFMFTHCKHVCPLTTPNIIKLEQMFKQQGLDVQFVSFTVDPQRDTPSVLTKYGQKYHDDFRVHHYLTGYDFSEIQNFASKNFNLHLMKMGNNDIMHGRSFYLINREGQIQNEYDCVTPNFDQIIRDVKALQ
jgi:protein SCO1